MVDRDSYVDNSCNCYETIAGYYYHEKMINQEKYEQLFYGVKGLSVAQLIEIYYKLGKAYSAILKNWVAEVCSRNTNKDIYVFERDCGILRCINNDLKSVWINYDIIDDPKIGDYLKKYDYANSIFLDVGLVGTLALKMMEITKKKINIMFLFSLNNKIDGYLNAYLKYYSDQFWISIVRTLEYVCKPVKKPVKLSHINQIEKLKYPDSIYSLIYNSFLKGIKDGDDDIDSGMKKLYRLYLSSLNNKGKFTGFITENYTVEKDIIDSISNKYEEVYIKNEA